MVRLPGALLSSPTLSICGMSRSSSHAKLKLCYTKVANVGLVQMQALSITICLDFTPIRIQILLRQARPTRALTSILAMA